MVMLSELLQWQDAAKEKPDADLTVLMYMPDRSDPVALGYWDDQWQEWTYDVGATCHHQVTHWAEMPGGPTEWRR